MTLYPYQEKCVEFALKHHFHLNCSDMGTGKSRIALETVRRARGRAIVFGPAFLRDTWLAEAETVGVDIRYLSYSMTHHVTATDLSAFDFWVADECFPGETLVDTPSGARRIDSLRPGDSVLSAAGVDTVVAIHKRRGASLVSINDAFEVTPNHPILTPHGWVSAGELREGDNLVTSYAAMRMVRGDIPRREGESWEVLREVLLSEMAHEAACGSIGCPQCRGKGEDSPSESREEAPYVFGMAQEEQLHAPRECSEEVISNTTTYRTQAGAAGRKWDRPDETRVGAAQCSRRRLGNAVCCHPDDRDREKSPVQDRRSEPEIENCDRGRRAKPLSQVEESPRCLEGRQATLVRVGSISIQECRGRPVYNLQVAKHPSYSVSGVLVHNCHMLKSPTAKRSDHFHTLLDAVRPRYFMGLTGTPIKNRVVDFWTLLAYCSLNTLGTSGKPMDRGYYAFAEHFCHVQEIKINGRKIRRYGSLREDRLPDLIDYLRDKYIKFRLADVLPELPPVSYKQITIANLEADGLVDDFEKFKATGAISTKKALHAREKAPHTVEYLKDMLEQGVDKILVFSDHVAPAEFIASQLGGACVTGKVDAETRMRHAREFQTGGLKVLSATIGSMSTGLTLTAAHHVVFNDLSWTPADNAQAEARIRRIGQAKPCLVHIMHGSETDKAIYRVLASKSKDANIVDDALLADSK